jgi:hypothetical protein
MNEMKLDTDKASAIAQTTARLDFMLQQMRKDEATLKRVLEKRRLLRRLKAVKPN